MRSAHNISEYRERIRRIVQYVAVLPDEQMNEFLSLFQLEVYPKNSVIINPKTTKNKLYFLVSGLVRIYYEAEGKEITSDIKEENTFFLNGYYLYTGLSNFDYHVSMTPTVVLSADYDELEALSAKYHEVEHMGRKMVELHYANFLISNYNQLFLSAEERLDVFQRERASLLNKVPLKYIASYLGIAPETLSRMRSKKT